MAETDYAAYDVAEIRDGLYSVSDGFFNTMFLLHEEGVIAIDAPITIGPNYLKAIRGVTDRPVIHVVYSHSHVDHIGAAHLFGTSPTYIAHEETAKILRERNDPRRPVPTTTFQDSYTLTVGASTLDLVYRGNNHQIGNIFIHAPRQRTLMLVDVVFPRWVPYKNLGVAQDVPGYIRAHDEALSYDFDTFVAGHVNRVGTRQDVETSREYVTDLLAAARAALSTTPLDPIMERIGPGAPWALFDTYQKEVIRKCTEQMLQTWRGRLNEAEVFTADNSWAMVESLNIDFAPPASDGETVQES